MSNRMKWVGIIGMFCWFVCGLSLGFGLMKRWQDSYYAPFVERAAHPVVKEVPLMHGMVDGWLYHDIFIDEEHKSVGGTCRPPAPPTKPAMIEHAPDYIDCDEQGKGAKCAWPKPAKAVRDMTCVPDPICKELLKFAPAKGSKRHPSEYERGYNDAVMHEYILRAQLEQDKLAAQPLPEKEPQPQAGTIFSTGPTCQLGVGGKWFFARADGKCYAADAPAGKP